MHSDNHDYDCAQVQKKAQQEISLWEVRTFGGFLEILIFLNNFKDSDGRFSILIKELPIC